MLSISVSCCYIRKEKEEKKMFSDVPTIGLLVRLHEEQTLEKIAFDV